MTKEFLPVVARALARLYRQHAKYSVEIARLYEKQAREAERKEAGR